MKRKSFYYGMLASFFFSFTFILNRSMSLMGGHFIWSAALRYLFTLPVFLIMLGFKGRLDYVHRTIRQQPGPWFLWSFVGFVLFYLPLTFASDYGSSWLVAASWQFTIVAGTLLTPLFGHQIPRRNLLVAVIILVGVFILQFDHGRTFRIEDTFLCIIPVVIAAIAYPLGNRKVMSFSPPDMTTWERVYGMTLCTIPFWVLLSIGALPFIGAPTGAQTIQAMLVALFSGLIATLLFFHATDLAKHDPKELALAESTIAGEVIFTLLGGILLLHDRLPGPLGWAGLIIIVTGMAFNKS